MKKSIIFFIIIFLLMYSFPSRIKAQPWPKTYGEPNKHELSFDVAEAYDKGYYLLGNITEQLVYTKSWLIKTHINGEILWEKVLINEGYNLSIALEPSMDGGVLLCGFIRSDEVLRPQPSVIKLNACGEKEWCKTFGENPNGSMSQWANDIKETPTGDTVVLVNQYGTAPYETMHLFKLNAQGEVLWRNAYCNGYEYPKSAQPFGQSILLTSENKYIITGDVYWEDPWNPGGVKVLRPLFIKVNSLGKEEWVLPFGLQDAIYGHTNHTVKYNEDGFVGVGRSYGQQVDREGIIVHYDISGNEIDYKIVNFQDIDTTYKVGLFWDIVKKDSVYIVASFFDSNPNGGAPPGELIVDTNVYFTQK